jgi:hypothetical protein
MPESVLYLYWSIFLVIFVCLYFLPSIIAIKRRHQSKVAIIILNTFSGLSGVGWFAALIWATSGVWPKREKA